jgi:uncharacterized radical SAM protein YgiQ
MPVNAPTPFLPVTMREARARGWDGIDIVLITGDAYVDHPAFGIAVIGRVLEAQGYRVGIIAMPDWNNPDAVQVFGRPRLFFGVSSGNVDSMLARYTAFKRYRHDDPYAPGGRAGRKPERALLTYCNLIKAAYKDTPLVIGGVEASMRRVAHYDFWSNTVRRSILEDSRADILLYGMGEHAIIKIARRLEQRALAPQAQTGAFPCECVWDGIPGAVTLTREPPEGACRLPAEEDVLASQATFVEFYRQFYQHQRQNLAQPTGKRWLVHTPPAELSTADLDAIYALPFRRQPHPTYTEPIPAFEMIKHSITAHRGCVSGCSFCSLGLHQGKRIVSRSPEAIMREAAEIAQSADFRGQITDIGGPSANMYGTECGRHWDCTRESCLFPSLCRNLRLGTNGWLDVLSRAARLPRVKKVTVGSGIRYDLLMREPEHRRLLRDVLARHISGQLKIAPEHMAPAVLRAMRKTPLAPLEEFVTLFQKLTHAQGRAQYPLPYLMSAHPGTTLADMQTMLREIQRVFHTIPQQVQAFIPLPMTLSSVIYYTGIDPLTGEHFPVIQDMAVRRAQHDVFFQHRKPPKKSGTRRVGKKPRQSS